MARLLPALACLILYCCVQGSLGAVPSGTSTGSLPRGPPSARLLQAIADAPVRIGDAVKDVVKVEDKSTLIWEESTTPDKYPCPWLPDSVDVFTSKAATKLFDISFAEEVPGLGATTFQQVFDILREEKCPVYVFGGMVRDSLLNKPAKDTDISFSCSAEEVARIADKHGWEHTAPKRGYIKLGHEEEGKKDQLEGKDAMTSLYVPTYENEFACNSLFYDPVNKSILDRVKGVPDVLVKVARLPCAYEEFDKWSEGPNGLNKSMRFWKMRIDPKNFNADAKTLELIRAYLRSLDKPVLRAGFAKFFKSRFAGLFEDKAAHTLYQLREAMTQDLGGAWYVDNIAPAEPACPYDLVKTVEPFVQAFMPAYKAAFAKMKTLAPDGTVSGRIRSPFTVWEECERLSDVTDIAGVRVTVTSTKDFETVRAAVEKLPKDKVTVVNDNYPEPRQSDGYRSYDFFLKDGDEFVEVQLRTPYMTHFAAWYRNTMEVKPRFAKNEDFKKYAAEISDFLADLDATRAGELTECPSILRNSALQNADVLSTKIVDGCFSFYDTSPTEGQRILDSSFLTPAIDGPGPKPTGLFSVSAADEAEEVGLVGCPPDFPVYSKAEVHAFILSYAGLYKESVKNVHKAVGHLGFITSRLKTTDSLFNNLYKKCKLLENYKDVVGIRVTFEDNGDVNKGIELLKAAYPGTKPVGDPEKLSPDGYRSVHFIPKLKDGRRIEIQLRTPYMSAWADWSHDLLYKGDYSIRTNPATLEYTKKMATLLLDLDKKRAAYPTCPEKLKKTVVSSNDETGVETNACFHWPDVATRDPPSQQDDQDHDNDNVSGKWPTSALWVVGILAVLLLGSIMFVLFVVAANARKKQHYGAIDLINQPLTNSYAKIGERGGP